MTNIKVTYKWKRKKYSFIVLNYIYVDMLKYYLILQSLKYYKRLKLEHYKKEKNHFLKIN